MCRVPHVSCASCVVCLHFVSLPHTTFNLFPQLFAKLEAKAGRSLIIIYIYICINIYIYICLYIYIYAVESDMHKKTKLEAKAGRSLIRKGVDK